MIFRIRTNLGHGHLGKKTRQLANAHAKIFVNAKKNNPKKKQRIASVDESTLDIPRYVCAAPRAAVKCGAAWRAWSLTRVSPACVQSLTRKNVIAGGKGLGLPGGQHSAGPLGPDPAA